MELIDKIDYMINTLELVKEELGYIRSYNENKSANPDFFFINMEIWDIVQKVPTNVYVRDMLKSISRISNKLKDENFVEYGSDTF